MNTNFDNVFNKIDYLLSSVEKIQKTLNKGEMIEPPPKNLSINQAIIFLKEKGFIISTSSIYKLTSSKLIPFKKFGNRLVFSEKELRIWVENKTKVSYESKAESTKMISSSARNKINK